MYLGFIVLSSKSLLQLDVKWRGGIHGEKKRTLKVNYSAKKQLVSMIFDKEMTRHFLTINKNNL